MNSPQKIPVLIAVGDFASGVTSWALRLRKAFENHGRYSILLVNCTNTGNAIGKFDVHATTTAEARELLAARGEAVVIPNFVWDLFPLCAAVNADGGRLRCIGFCRSDSDSEYYTPLRWYAPLVSEFAAVSPACARKLAGVRNTPRADIHVLPSGVWVPPALERPYQTAPIRLAYGGRIVQEQKRVMDFLPLVRALYDRGIDFTFDIAGAGRQRAELEAAMKTADPGGRVRFIPRLKPDAMPAFWAAHDVFVQVSAFEGTSNSMLEAMAQGTVPVMTQTASGVDGIIRHGENGLLAPVGEMNALAEAIASVAAAPDLLASMGAAAHEAVKPLAMEHYVEKFTRLLDSALASPPRQWPEGQSPTPPAPFHGIRLAEGGAKKRRLGIIFPSPLRGGAEDYTLQIASGAVGAGYDVQAGFPGKAALSGLAQDYVRAGAIYHTLDICDVGPRSERAPLVKRFTRTRRFLRRVRPEAVLLQLCGIQYGFLSQLACALAGTPVLVVFQLVRGDVRISPLRRPVYRWMRRRQRYVAVSQANRTLLAHAFRMREEDILVIPNGVDLARFSPDAPARAHARCRLRDALGLPGHATLCLSAGRLSHQKGYDVLVPAIPHILARHPDVHFVWAGDGPLERELRDLLATYGVADNVTFLGRREDMPDLFQACDLFVHPARFEGQPFSVLEAMASGLPVVSTSASGIAEVITDGEHGLLCRTDDIAALREAVLAALDRPERMARMAEAARARVGEFGEEAMVRQTLDALDTLGPRP